MVQNQAAPDEEVARRVEAGRRVEQAGARDH
jgi:hypothetical protein